MEPTRLAWYAVHRDLIRADQLMKIEILDHMHHRSPKTLRHPCTGLLLLPPPRHSFVGAFPADP